MTVSTETMLEFLRAQLAYRGIVLADVVTGKPLAADAKTWALHDLAELAIEATSPNVRTVPRTTTKRMPVEILDHARALSKVL